MPDSMSLRTPQPARCGRVVVLEHPSKVLADNRLGDPSTRKLSVYLPPGYVAEGPRRYPVLWYLAAYTSSGPAQLNWRNHGENLIGRIDRLIDEGILAPVLCVLPDCYTALGGNQYVNSTTLGSYADYLLEELLPLVDRQFMTIPDASARAVFGKSSGGFGALHLAMRYPGHFSAVASHAGDCGFDRVYTRDFPACAQALALHGGDPASFVRAFWRDRRPRSESFHALMTLCLAASYSPDESAPLGLQLPFDPYDCSINPEVWARWLAYDPILEAPSHAEALAGLTALWIDAGDRDQYCIQYGTRALHTQFQRLGIDHYYEEFEGDHSAMDWRFDRSLPWLVSRLNRG